ncbi:hypothetical protein AX769_17055 [Frondihabitans sp. PAMC 28766]|uniref:LacI family DNA-binding transcriptional regulator n=1 Tax=Frondihabitans sp. PAMC 28766 TaxID=1795630 RepID=UPI00078B5185|nr:substrate-binding domain-containing protein [Frondihabitans sp. PAMC 28766]AMM21538.1 hypothetical protein AX769_17055 [Frondihabitans sp. PAMC 28766]
MKDIGLVLVQSARRAAHDPLISSLGHGLEETLVKSDMRLVTRVVTDAKAEAQVYRSWAASTAVDAIVLLRLQGKDSRVGLLDGLGLPFAAIADEEQVGDFSAVVVDNAATMRTVLDHLVSRGHDDVAYVSAASGVSARSCAFTAEAERRGVRGRTLEAPLTREGGAHAAAQLLTLEPRPTAVVFDDDVTARAGLDLLVSRGIDVPGEMAVVAWNDSVLCQAATPPLTAVSNESHAVGQLAARCLIEMNETGEITQVRSPAAFIVERSSS